MFRSTPKVRIKKFNYVGGTQTNLSKLPQNSLSGNGNMFDYVKGNFVLREW